MKVPWLKRLLSYLAPVWIRKGNSKENPDLELLLYRGRWQLATGNAIYSDADKYTPILVAYAAMTERLKNIKSVLVLGSGLGSAVQIMAKMGYSPDFTLVDNDQQILDWAQELMPQYEGGLKLTRADARFYLDVNRNKYDLLIIDVFIGQNVPEFITTEIFMQNCRDHINEGGSFILNYILKEDQRWLQLKVILNKIFPGHREMKDGINRIIIATI